MNDGTPCQRSTLASHPVVKTEAEADQAEKALMVENNASAFAMTTKLSPRKREASSSLADRIGKTKSDKMSPSVSNMGEGDMKASGDAEEDEGFDMSLVPLSFPQRVSPGFLSECVVLRTDLSSLATTCKQER